MAEMSDLEPAVGRWKSVIHHEAFPDAPEGEMTNEWLRGEKVLLQRSTAEEPSFPEGVIVMMADDEADSLAAHYFDSRGVVRHLRMTLEDGVWKWWREASGPDDFAQRFEGTFSEDGKTIEAVLHRTEDGEWIHDFDVTYTRQD